MKSNIDLNKNENKKLHSKGTYNQDFSHCSYVLEQSKMTVPNIHAFFNLVPEQLPNKTTIINMYNTIVLAFLRLYKVQYM